MQKKKQKKFVQYAAEVVGVLFILLIVALVYKGKIASDLKKQNQEIAAKKAMRGQPFMENNQLDFFKKLISQKLVLGEKDTTRVTLLKVNDDKTAFKVGVDVNCMPGAGEENIGCSGIEVLVKRSDDTWAVVGFNGPCEESQDVCLKVDQLLK